MNFYMPEPKPKKQFKRIKNVREIVTINKLVHLMQKIVLA